jgi:hypothetical protein
MEERHRKFREKYPPTLQEYRRKHGIPDPLERSWKVFKFLLFAALATQVLALVCYAVAGVMAFLG